MFDLILEYLRWVASFLKSFFESPFLNYINPLVGENNHPEHYYYFSNVEKVMVAVCVIGAFIISYYLFQILDRAGDNTCYRPTPDRRHKNWLGHIFIGPIALIGGYILSKLLPVIIFLVLTILSIAMFVLVLIAPLIIASVTAALIFKGLEKRAQPTPETE